MIKDILLYSIIAIFIGISQAAGVGGGPVLNISLMVGAGYTSKESMSITYVFLMGGAIASIITNFNKTLTHSKLLLMDYNLILISLPMIASGSIFGTLLNHYFSELVVSVMFVAVLIYISINTYKKIAAFSTQNNETFLNQNIQLLEIHKQRYPEELQQILKEQQNPLPWSKIAICFGVFVYTVIILLIKGGQHFKSIVAINSCGVLGNFIVFLHFGMSLYCTHLTFQHIINIQDKKEAYDFIFEHEGDKFTSQKKWSAIISGFFAGLAGGCLGLGGAIILVPVWISSGMNQERVVATSPPLIFFSASISFTICLLCNRYHSFMQIFYYFCLSYIGAAVVKKIAKWIAEKYHLKTMILSLLLFTMVLSLAGLVPFQMLKFYRDTQKFMAFGEFC